jgi:hypothetical protein
MPDGGGGTRNARFPFLPLRQACACHLPLAGEDRKRGRLIGEVDVHCPSREDGLRAVLDA